MQGSETLKRKKAGRKSCWPEEFVEEVSKVVCESECCRKKNGKADIHKLQRNKISSVGTTELYNSTKKWQYSFDILKSFFRPTLIRV